MIIAWHIRFHSGKQNFFDVLVIAFLSDSAIVVADSITDVMGM